jgi:soluble lytic murein transglycosylase-like protein
MSPQPVLGVATADTGALAASERIQHLNALIAQVEEGPAGFAAALRAAQATPTTAQTSAADSATADTSIDAYGSTGAYGSTVSPYASTTVGYPSTTGAASGLYSTGADPAVDQGAAIPTVYQSLGTASPVDTADTSTTAAPTGAGAYSALIEQAAARNGLDPAVLYGLIQQESGFDPSATSSAGALGLTQLMPGTAASLGVTEPLNPAQSIEGGARYLGELMRQFGGDTSDALAAYNAGPGAVQHYGGIPPYPETQQYVTNVLANAAAYQQSTAGATSTANAASTAATAAVSTTTPGTIT